MNQKATREEGSREDLDAIDGEETAEDTLLETGAENNNLVLFIHDWSRKSRREEQAEMSWEISDGRRGLFRLLKKIDDA